MKAIIEDAFYITGRGYILAITIPFPSAIDTGDTIEIEDEGESYAVSFVESSKLMTHPPQPFLKIGVGVREMKNNKEFYVGKHIVKN